MRVNIYDNEVRDRVEVVSATAGNTGMTFFGVRIYVGDDIEDCDETGGVTWWIPWTKSGGHDLDIVEKAFTNALECVAEIRHRLLSEDMEITQ